ncbi:hypothetical protein NB706_003171 [Xanthomonas sacchari]|nr:hypothetical protein [Xanthomonas sacchari]
MRAQRRQIAEQGVGQSQEAEAGIEVAAVAAGLAQHVRQRHRQRGVGVVHVAAGDAVGQVVAHAAAVLLQHLRQVARAAGQHRRQHLVEATALPVRQDQERGGGGDRAADQGVEQARPDQHEAVADQVEAEQRHHRDRRGGKHVAVGAGDEEHQRAEQGEQQLQLGAREQLHQRPRRAQADQGAGDALGQAQAGGAVVGPAHEGGGQQDPVAVAGVDRLHDGVAHHQRDGHAQPVPEQHRAGRELLAQAPQHLAQGVRRGVAQAGVEGVAGGVRLRGLGQAPLDAVQVGHQQFQRAEQPRLPWVGTGVQEIQRLAQVGGGLLGLLAVVERLAQPDRLAQRRAGLALQGQQALAAVQHVAVEERVGQRLVRVVRGTGALVEVLRHVVQAEIQARLHAGPAGAAEAADDRGLGRVECGHHLRVLLGQRQPPRVQVALPHRLEQGRLEPQVAAQLQVQPRQPLAHRPVGEQHRPQHRQHRVPAGAEQQQGHAVPGVAADVAVLGAVVQADHRVDRQRHRGLGDGGVAFAERAEQGQGEGGQRQAGRERPRIREQQHHRGRGGGETQQRQQHRLDPAQPVVVGFGDGAGDGAQENRRHRLQLLQVPAHAHRHRQRDEDAQPVAGLFVGPQAAEAGFDRGGRHGNTIAHRRCMRSPFRGRLRPRVVAGVRPAAPGSVCTRSG